MSLFTSVQSELVKTKRSASFWMSLLGAGVIPLIFLLVYIISPEKTAPSLQKTPWEIHFFQGYQQFASFLLPMFVILICSQIPQIEYKNNTWKQVFASPQSIGNIFFSKYIAIMLMVLFLFLMYNIFMLLAAVIPNLVRKEFTFLDNPVNWKQLFRLNLKTFISLLAIISIQYWLSLRFKNFIVAIGLGLALLITSIMMFGFQWEHVYKVPYAFPLLSLTGMVEKGEGGPLFLNHELNSIGYFIFFTVLAFLDMKYRKERG
ncbi:MAG: ABC transporter permease [Chitinophagaceae bacterium]